MDYSKEHLVSLDSQRLNEILDDEFERADANVQLIETITDILIERASDFSVTEPEHARETFWTQYADTEPLYGEVMEEMDSESQEPTKRSKSRHGIRKLFITITVAAVLLLSGTVAASAAGFDLWESIMRWSADTFGYSKMDYRDEIDVSAGRDSCELLRNVFLSYNVTVPVVPYYLPDGYTSFDIGVEDSFEGILITSIYKKDDDQTAIIITYLISHDEASGKYYPADDLNPEIYISHSIEHYITSNEGNYRVSWINSNIICDISGVDNSEDLILIIESIYNGD